MIFMNDDKKIQLIIAIVFILTMFSYINMLIENNIKEEPTKSTQESNKKITKKNVTKTNLTKDTMHPTLGTKEDITKIDFFSKDNKNKHLYKHY